MVTLHVRGNRRLASSIIVMMLVALLMPALGAQSTTPPWASSSTPAVPDHSSPAAVPEPARGSEPTRAASVLPLERGTEFGGAGNEWVTDSVSLPNGTTFLIGYSNSFDLPNTAGSFQPDKSGDIDCFIARVEPNRTVSRATYFGGHDNDFGQAIGYRNETGQVYIAGYTESDNETDLFPTTQGSFQRAISNDNFEAFVAVLSGDLKSLSYATYFGGILQERVYDLVVAESGLALIVGGSNSPNLPMEGLSENSTHGGAQDGFVAMHNVTAGAGSVSYSSYVGSKGTDIVTAAVILEQNATDIDRICLTGLTDAENFNHKFSIGAYATTFTSGFTHFLVYQNFTTSGVENDYGTFLGEGGISNLTYDMPSLAHDGALGAVLIVASVTSSWPTAGVGIPQSAYGGGARDAWLAWFSERAGNGAPDLLAATFWGGSGEDHGMDVAVSPHEGHALVVGSSTSSNAPLAGLRAQTLTDDRDAWVARYPRPVERRTHLNYSTLLDWGSYSEVWTVTADERSDYPLCAGLTTPSSVVFREVVLPTEPTVHLLASPEDDAIQDVGDTIRVNATVRRGSNLTGSELDRVALVLVFTDESTDWIDATALGHDLYSVEVTLNSSEDELEAWYFGSISRDNGQTWHSASASAEAFVPPTEVDEPGKLVEEVSLTDVWGDYGLYVIAVLITVVVLLLALAQQPNALGVLIAAVTATGLVWLSFLNIPNLWEPWRVVTTYGFIALWGNAPTLLSYSPFWKPNAFQAISFGFALAFGGLVASLLVTVTPVPWVTLVIFSMGIIAGLAGAIPRVGAVIVAGVAWFFTALSLAIPAIAEWIVSALGGMV